MAGLHFDITGDNSNLMDKLKQTESGIRQTAKTIEQSGVGMERMFSNIAKAAAGIGAAFSAQQFAGQVMKVRGEFQQLEVAFTTMLGSAEKANALMTQLTRTAAVTPFGLQEVAGGAKQLLAYGVASEKVNDTLVRLGDVAAGLSIPLNDLVYLYGTTMTQGRLFTQDLRQFQGRGIPLADELAKQFGVTKDKIGELVTAGKVGFGEVEKAIVSMTSQGGKFGGLMEAQSKTIIGQISNIEDAIDGMFNQIGQSSEGVINAALGGVSKLVENWEKVAETIGYAASAYGSYKAALMVTSAVEGIKTEVASSEEIAGLRELLDLKEDIKNADLEEAVAKGTLSQAKAEQMASLREEVQARLASLKLMEEEALAEEKAALSAFNMAQKEKQAADERLENMMNLMEAAEAQGDASYTAYAQEQLQTAAANANTAATRLNTAEKNLNAASSKAKAASQSADTFAINVNTVANNANTTSMKFMKAAALQLQTILKGLWATLMANPLAIVVGAIGALAYGIYQYATRASAAEKITKQFNDVLAEQEKKHNEQKQAIDDLVSTLGNVEVSEGKRIDNFQKLKAEYPEILKDINTENEFLKEKHRILQLINKEQAKEQQKDNEYQLRLEEQKLKRWEQHRQKYGDTSLVDVDGNGWASDNVIDAINAQKEIVAQLKANISQPIVETYLSKIKELKDENIAATIDEITNTLVALEGAGDNAIGILSSMGKEFSKSQLKTMKAALEGEQDSRGGEKKTASQWLAKYKKEYEAAEKAITDFQKKSGEMSEELFERNLKELKDKRDAAKKKYEEAGGNTKQNKDIEKQKKAKEEVAKELLALEEENQQAEINLMKDGSKKRLAQINADFEKRKNEIKKQAEEFKKANKEASVVGLNADGLTKEQQDAINKSIEINKVAKKQATKEVYDNEKRAMDEFLAEYGTYLEKKKALDDLYKEKIEDASTEGERNSLRKELRKRQTELDAEAEKKGVNWDRIFGDVSYRSIEALKKMREEIRKVILENENLSVEDIKSLYEQYNKVGEAIDDSSLSLKKLLGFTNAEKDAAKRLKDEYEELKDIFDELIQKQNKAKMDKSLANKDLVDFFKKQTGITITGNESYEKLEGLLKGKGSGESTLPVMDTFKTLFNNNEQASQSLAQVTQNVKGAGEAMGKAGEMMQGAGGSAASTIAMIDKIIHGINNNVQSLPALLDELSNEETKFKEFADKFAESSQYATNALESLKSGDIIGTVSGVLGSLRTLGEGLGKLEIAGMGESDVDLAKDIERLSASNDNLRDAIDNLSEKMDKAAVADATQLYEEQKRYLLEAMANTSEMMKRSGEAYSEGFFGVGGTHSTNYRIDEDMNASEWARISKITGTMVKNASDFFSLTSEQMANVKDQANDLYSKIEALADDGYANASQYMDEYIGYYKQLEEIEDAWREKLTSSSFDSVRDDFKSTLIDMESDTEDFGEAFEDIMKNAVMESLISSKYDSLLKKWYEDFAKNMEDGILDENEKNSLKSRWDDMAKQAIEDRNAMVELGLISNKSNYTQDASTKGYQTMSQETASALEGRFTALQISNEEIKNQMIQAVAIMNQMVVINSQGNVVLNDILMQQALANNYLADIVKNTKVSALFGEKLDAIIENTKNL